MATEYQIAALWMEGRLSFLEELCLKSFLDAGHHVVLYHYGPLENVPEGVELKDAEDILPRAGAIKHERTGSPALHSDIFRYRMLAKMDRTIWADTDAYCRKPFETPNGHFYGWESSKHINGGVLGLPADSDTLGELLAYTADEFSIPPWYGEDYEQQLLDARDRGDPVHAGDQPWGVWGPHALTYFLHKTGEAKYALPQEGLYPFTFRDRRFMFKPNFDTSEFITENTYSIHLYGRRVRARIAEKDGGLPPKDSLIEKLVQKHGVDPTKSPVPLKPRPKDKGRVKAPKPDKTIAEIAAMNANRPAELRAPKPVAPMSAPAPAPVSKASATVPAQAGTPGQPLPPELRHGRGQMNLTDLADRFGSDKGSSKHRYTELYQMLFLPYRQRAIKFLEMGLLIGGPEHGKSADRKTDDLPSVRMWLEYFPKAEIHGLDVSDFSWFEHERFNFHRCDMDTRENIRAVAEPMPQFDIIIDDASHASHHQQNAFLELFDRVKSGGLYIIEDLRWQPDAMEKPGITKTADLFQTYIHDGYFTHGDPAIAAEFDSHRADISGCFMFQVRYEKKRKDQVLVVHKR